MSEQLKTMWKAYTRQLISLARYANFMYGKTGDETFGDLAEKYVDRAKQALFCWDTIQDGHFRWN